MSVKINPTWEVKLRDEFQKNYFIQLIDFVKKEYQLHKIYPAGANIFKAFDACNFDDVRVVIIGQDPYHGEGQANGLCFSVNDGIKFPPSLQNIFKEIQSDLGKPFPATGNLDRWAKQGVLLLNATLTVRAEQAGSHQNQGWEQFTDAVIAKLAEERTGIVFLLWGSYAQKKGAVIDPKKHCVLTSVHPSPLSAHRGFLGCKHFSKANNYLKSISQMEIDW
jgi:uracil-DNA glycosylase